MQWFSQVKRDLSKIIDMIDFYQMEAIKHKSSLRIQGRLEHHAASLPAEIEECFNQLQDIEAVLEMLNIKYRRCRSEKFRKFFENSNLGRVLTSKDCDRYVDCDPDVVDLAELINEVALIRNMYLGLIKGMENKQWQITNIVKLRAVGIQDAEV
jgi:hypothetical protein